MGVTGSGALNSSAFSQSLASGSAYRPGSASAGYLPHPTHLTYQGLFNELRYSVGPKTDKVMDIHHGYARFQFKESQFDSNINDYLALFLKGKADGQPREESRVLNAVICLDISGSMNLGLGSFKGKHHTRISLCIEAIKMFISKLRPNDSIGMTTFDQQAHLIFEPVLKKDLTEDIYSKLDEIKAAGHNTLIDGFNMSKRLLLAQKQNQPKKSETTGHQLEKTFIKRAKKDNVKDNVVYENRIILLSDVEDNSIHYGIQDIKSAASVEDIHLTIIGISTHFNSKACEYLKDTQGFNYFSAVNEEDILKYMFETFDYTFFPTASDVKLVLQSDNVKSIEVFGTPDGDSVKTKPYQEETSTTGNYFQITRIKSCFPSEIEIDKEQVFTVGGLILIKIQRKQRTPFFRSRVHLSYRDDSGEQQEQTYELNYEFHPEEQFLSSETLRQAISAFIYTSEVKNILENASKIGTKQTYQTYYPMLLNLKELCPSRKQVDYSNILKIVEGYKPKEEANTDVSPPLEKVK